MSRYQYVTIHYLDKERKFSNTRIGLMDSSIEEKKPDVPSGEQTATTLDVQNEKRSLVKQRLFSIPSIVIILISLLLSVLISSYLIFQNELKKTIQITGTSPQQMTKSESLIAATDATFPPMESINESGKLVGYDIDLGRSIGTELGMKLTFKNVKWEDIFSSLERKEVDIIISSVSITDERKKKYNSCKKRGYLLFHQS